MDIQPFHEFIPNRGVFHIRIWEVEGLEQRSARVDALIVISGVLKSIGTRHRLLSHVSTRRTFRLAASHSQMRGPNIPSRSLHSRWQVYSLNEGFPRWIGWNVFIGAP